MVMVIIINCTFILIQLILDIIKSIYDQRNSRKAFDIDVITKHKYTVIAWTFKFMGLMRINYY